MKSSFLNIEISDQKIRYIFVEKKGKGISFLGRGESTVKVDPSAQGVLTSYINELISKQGIKIEAIFVTINRKDNFVYQLSLPKMSKEDLDTVVSSEIEKVSNFADQEFDFIYHEYPAEDQTKTKVLFAGVTDVFLQHILAEIKATHIPCRALEVAPLNVTGLLFMPQFKDSVQSLIILSDRMTHLLVFKNQQIKFFYTTNIGQDSLSNENQRSNWVEELKRVLKSFSLENKRDFINKNWIIWDQEKFPLLDEQLRKEYGHDAHPLNILKEWVGEDINPMYLITALPSIYLLGNIKPQFALNHFLKSSNLQDQVRQLTVISSVFLVVIGIIFGAVFFHFNQLSNQTTKASNDIQHQINDVESKSPDLLKLREDYKKVRDQLLFQATYVKLLNRMSWSETLSVVASELPEELSLTSFKVSDSGQATFTGEAFRMESVAQLLRKVETSAILKQGKFNYLNQEEVDKKKIYKFGILANIKLGDE